MNHEAEENVYCKIKSKSKPKLNKTNDSIEWAKWTWNPVTGCKMGCKYCYARDIGMRFNGHFNPEFHPDRLTCPANTTIPKSKENEIGIKNVFVCSMADLFGDWVPQEWIDKVIEVVRINPQWNFIFLTKNPKRLVDIKWPDNSWVGTTIDNKSRVTSATESFQKIKAKVKFLSCEPLKEDIGFTDLAMFNWIIIGGQSASTGEPAFQPKWEWVEKILVQARKDGCNVYFKPNLTVRPKEYPEKEQMNNDLITFGTVTN